MGATDSTHDMKDGDSVFPMTSWTLVLSVSEQKEAKARFYDLYRRPLCCLLRRRGFSREDAEEYTQDFLTQILLGRTFTEKIDRKKARKFRSFLVKAFLNHVCARLRKKRPRLLNDLLSDFDPAVALPDAARVFDHEWAVGILQSVLEDVKAQCQREGLDMHWQVFVRRVLAPALDGVEPPPLSDICSQYGIPSAGQVSNMIVTVKRRFRRSLQRCLVSAADSPRGFEDELTDFLEIFSNG